MRGAENLRFGQYLLDVELGIVIHPNGDRVTLRPKAFDVLVLLARNAGRPVSRGQILDAAWPGLFVSDDSVTQCIVEIRRALGAEGGHLLRTLPKRGYILDVAPDPAPPAEAPRDAVGQRPPQPLLAILPFRRQPADATLTAFGEVLLEGIVGTLATRRDIAVISTNSTRHLDGTDADVPSLGRRLGADFIGFGTLRRLGGAIRLTVEVAEAALGAVQWHRTYDLAESTVFQAPDELAASIAHTIAPRIEAAELRRARAARDHDISAYRKLLEGRRLMMSLDPASFEAAGVMLREAAAMDPGFAAPHAALGDWYSLRIGQRWTSDFAADLRELEASVHRALELDAGQSRALALLGHTYTLVHRRHDDALDLLGRALDLAPNDSETCLWTGPTYAFAGEPAEAVRRAERAIRLSPEDPLMYRHEHFLSIAHYAAGAFEEAAFWGERSLRRNPAYLSNLRLTGASLAAIGRTDEAGALTRRAIAIEPSSRARDLVARAPYRSEAMRRQYGRHLEAAGLPP